MILPKRPLGKTGVEVTVLGLGGEGILRTFGQDKRAYELINRALDLGINYCESARAYSGSESYYGDALKERRRQIFLTSKSHARDRQGALLHLHETLRNMKTDYLDLWQIHDVRTHEDVARIFGPDGAYEAFREAKQKGTVRFIGVTGHHDPAILEHCISNYEFDTVLLPVNPAEPLYKSFLGSVVPVANERGMGVVGMKVYFGGMAERIQGVIPMQTLLRFALSQNITVCVIGCRSIEQLELNFNYASDFVPMSQTEMEGLSAHLSPVARTLMYYKP